MSSPASVISQVYRDKDNLVSQTDFEAKYALIIRAADATATVATYMVNTKQAREFEESISFPTSFQASILTDKLNEAYNALAEFVDQVSEDLYIDQNEAAMLLSNIQKLMSKIIDVIEIEEQNDFGNQDKLEQCLLLFDRGCALFEESLSLAFDSTVMDEDYYRTESERIHIRPFSSFAFKNLSFLLGNILAIVLWYFWSFPWMYPVVLIYGSLAYHSHKRWQRREKQEFDALAESRKDQKMKLTEYLERFKSIDSLPMQ